MRSYSQMKWLASLEGKQFRTLSPGRGLPSQGLVRHIGSQIANAEKVIQARALCVFSLFHVLTFCVFDVHPLLPLHSHSCTLYVHIRMRTHANISCTFEHVHVRTSNDDKLNALISPAI